MKNTILALNRKLSSINKLSFLICLSLLLLNDFYFKYEYHNWVTGKLSDFCGLFVFVTFWNAIFKSKKNFIYFISAFLFILWKSPYSQGFIDFFSQYFYTISRVMDVTDLLALSVLPVAYFYSEKKYLAVKFINPLLLGAVTIFSFCSTSKIEPNQSFEQAQYVLFNNNYINTENGCKRINDFKFYKLDSFLIVEIKTIKIPQEPILEGEYQKVKILKNLDLFLLKELNSENCYIYKNDLNLIKIRDSLIVQRSIELKLKTENYTDYLYFKDSRLYGKFRRFSNENKLLIEGQYLDGLEDNTWKFYENDNIVLSMTFEHGEKISEQNYENGIKSNKKNIWTRKKIIHYKYFQLGLLLLALIFLILKLVSNYKKSKNNFLKYSDFIKITLSLLLPFIVMLIRSLFYLIPNAFSSDFISIFIGKMFIYLLLLALFLIVFYSLKIRNKYDFILYVLIFSLAIVFFQEFNYVISLTNDMPDLEMFKGISVQ